MFTINANGTGLTRVVGLKDLVSPSFSPDGHRILYTQGPQIRTIGVDGTDPRRALRTDEPASARYSPNGRRIVFAGAPRIARTQYGIWTMRNDGSRLRRLTSNAFDGAPDYSPDGRHIAFVRIRGGRFQRLMVMRADGSRQRRIVDDEFVYGRPAFAPAGDRIAYQRGSVPVDFEGSACSDIFTVALDGTDRRNVTQNCFPARTSDINDGSPSWQPILPPPSSEFESVNVKRDRKQGTAKLRLEVPGGGNLRLKGTTLLKAAGRRMPVAGPVTLPVKARGNARRLLRKRGAASVRAVVIYTPYGAEPSTKSKRIRLKRRR